HFPSMTLSALSSCNMVHASCVCRVWNSVAIEELDLVVKAFTMQWRIKELFKRPFVISHRISRGDSVTSLTVKYSVQV
ncbi:hypothetical protein EUTSA_v10024156mg, partial [Eutrema salsugineum]